MGAEFIPGYSKIVRPLRKISKKDVWAWSAEHERAFMEIKQAVKKSLTLAYPNFKLPLTLEVDASSAGLGAVLVQEGRVVRVAFRATTPAESALPATFLELSAVIWAVTHFRRYLRGRKFSILTDHKGLQWLRSLKHASGKLALWALQLADYDFTIAYRPGKENGLADALSRRLKVMAAIGTDDSLEEMPSTLELIAAQDQDVEVQDLRRRLDEGDAAALRGFVIDLDGVVCSLALRHGYPVLRPLIPAQLRQRVLSATHRAAAHLVAGTLKLLKDNFFWKGQLKDAELFVKQCLSCQKRKDPTGPRQIPEGTVSASSPNQLIACDLLSGLPVSEGFNYIMVIQDYFSRFVTTVPLRSKSAAETAAALLRAWIVPFGAPESLLTDQGTEFLGEFALVLAKYRVSHRFTTPYHPETDGMVERTNRTLLQAISTSLHQHQTAWAGVLPSVTHAINASPASATGHSPHFVFFGREPVLRNVVRPVAPAPESRVLEQRALKAVRAAVGKKELERVKKVEARNKRHGSPLEFHAGDWVMVKDPGARQALASKLVKSWNGPALVTERRTPTTYRVKQPPFGMPKTVHVKNMKKFNGQVPATGQASQLASQQHGLLAPTKADAAQPGTGVLPAPPHARIPVDRGPATTQFLDGLTSKWRLPRF